MGYEHVYLPPEPKTLFLIPAVESGFNEDLGVGGSKFLDSRPVTHLQDRRLYLNHKHGAFRGVSGASPHQAVRSQTGVRKGPQWNPSSPHKEGN